MITRALARRAAVATLMLAGASAQAVPTLIGDTLDFLRAWPTVDTPYGPSIPSTTVAAGPSDQVAWVIGTTTVTAFDPEADRISFSVMVSSGYGGGNFAGFDGYVVSGFDHDIASVSVLSNDTGLSIGLSQSLRSFAIDLDGNGAAATSFVIGVTLVDPPPPIPEPGTSALAAAGLGVVALMARRRRRSPA